jgi:hypothetical protein
LVAISLWLIFGGYPFHVVHHDHFHGDLLTLQAQAKCFLERGEKSRRCLGVASGGLIVVGPAEFEVVDSIDGSLIYQSSSL